MPRLLTRSAAITVIATACITPVIAAAPAVAVASQCGPKLDTIPPQVTDVSFSTSTIDLDSGSRTDTITATATDTSGNGTPSGVKSILIYLRHDYDNGIKVQLKESAGTPADGTWTGSFTLSKYASSGPLALTEVDVADNAGNSAIDEPGTPGDVSQQDGWQTSITVIGTPAKHPRPPRTVAGTLTDFRFSPTAVNTTRASKTVQIHATFGGQQPEALYVNFDGPSGPLFADRVRIAGHSGDTWTGTVPIARWLGDHSYHPEVFAQFGPGARPDYRFYNSKAVKTSYFHTPLTVTSAPQDTTPPSLSGLTLTPTSVNTRTGAETVTIRAHLADAKSGVARASVDFIIRNGDAHGGPASGLYLHPGDGYDVSSRKSSPLTRSTGHLWTGTAIFPECALSGRWTVEVGTVDRRNNSTVYHSTWLRKAGLQSTIKVTSTPGDNFGPYLYRSSASAKAHTISLTFSEGVRNVTASDLSVFVGASTDPAPISSITCRQRTTVVPCSGSGRLVTAAVLHVPTATQTRGDYQMYVNLYAVRSQLTDGTGNPMSWNVDNVIDIS